MVATRDPKTDCRSVASGPIGVLSARCREELARYRRGAACDDGFCLALFRRAVVDRDDAAWQELQAIFHEQVLTWCRSATGRSGADSEELVCIAWEKFWAHFTPCKLVAARDAAWVLRYLKMCARSAAFDALRSRGPELALDEFVAEHPDRHPLLSEAHADNDARARFWAIVNASLRDDRERVMAHLSYELGLKPCQIQCQQPDLFPSIVDVYQVTRNVLDRLKRNRELRLWCEQEGKTALFAAPRDANSLTGRRTQ